MPSDVFWTGLFTFGGGLVGAATGYATARLQMHAHEGQLDLEERRLEIELTQLGEAKLDRRREERRAIYLEYLKALDAIVNCPTHEHMDHQVLSSRWSAFMQADNELELAGTEAIKDRSYPLHTIAAEAMDRFSNVLDDDGLAWPNDASSYMRSIEEELRTERQGMVSLMRDDLLSD